MKKTASAVTLISVLLITLLLVDAPSSKAVSEMPQPEWSRTYTRSIDYSINGYPVTGTKDRGFFVIQTIDGGFAIGGLLDDNYHATAIGQDRQNGTLIKTDSSGDIQWQKQVSILHTISLFQTEDLGFLMIGDQQVEKLDQNGNLQWSKTFIGPQNGQGSQTHYGIGSGLESKNGDYVYAGSIPDYFEDAVILRTDKSGNLLWQETASSDAGWLRFTDLVETSSGDFAVVGHTVDGAWFALFNANGDWKLNETLGAGFFNSLVQTKDGGFVLAGGTFVGGVDDQGQGSLAKITSDGRLEWIYTYDNPPLSHLQFLSVAQTGDNGFVMAGRSSLLKVNESGSLKWNISYGDTSGDPSANSAISVVSTNDGGFAVVGPQNGSIWIAKFAPETNVPFDETSPFTTIWIVIAVIAAVVVGAGLLVYLKKRKR